MITFSPSTYQLPAISMVASPTKRQAILDIAVDAERRGFAGIACPSLGGTLGLCVSLAHVTSTIPFWTSIQPMYYSHPVELGNTAAHIYEVSGGRFGLGIGVSHGPVISRLGVTTGKPLADIENYVKSIRNNERFSGQLPQIFLAALRDKMLGLATEISEGAIWANASLRDIQRQVALISPSIRDQFMLSNMVPTVVSDDLDAAYAIHRKTLTGYVSLPNYRNYWRSAGYEQEMDDIESVIATAPKESLAEQLQRAMTDEWLRDCTISGSADQIRNQFAQWANAGVLPIAVMSSTSGGQAKAIAELFSVYEN